MPPLIGQFKFCEVPLLCLQLQIHGQKPHEAKSKGAFLDVTILFFTLYSHLNTEKCVENKKGYIEFEDLQREEIVTVR